jgi:hypothetical protein
LIFTFGECRQQIRKESVALSGELGYSNITKGFLAASVESQKSQEGVVTDGARGFISAILFFAKGKVGTWRLDFR